MDIMDIIIMDLTDIVDIIIMDIIQQKWTSVSWKLTWI